MKMYHNIKRNVYYMKYYFKSMTHGIIYDMQLVYILYII